jgi:hypothetical protein
MYWQKYCNIAGWEVGRGVLPFKRKNFKKFLTVRFYLFETIFPISMIGAGVSLLLRRTTRKK